MKREWLAVVLIAMAGCREAPSPHPDTSGWVETQGDLTFTAPSAADIAERIGYVSEGREVWLSTPADEPDFRNGFDMSDEGHHVLSVRRECSGRWIVVPGEVEVVGRPTAEDRIVVPWGTSRLLVLPGNLAGHVEIDAGMYGTLDILPSGGGPMLVRRPNTRGPAGSNRAGSSPCQDREP